MAIDMFYSKNNSITLISSSFYYGENIFSKFIVQSLACVKALSIITGMEIILLTTIICLLMKQYFNMHSLVIKWPLSYWYHSTFTCHISCNM